MDPYANGYAVDLGDGDVILERYPLQPNLLTHINTIHKVLDGETVQNIAFRYYGDSGYWMLICDANSMYDPLSDLKVGMELIIP